MQLNESLIMIGSTNDYLSRFTNQKLRQKTSSTHWVNVKLFDINEVYIITLIRHYQNKDNYFIGNWVYIVCQIMMTIKNFSVPNFQITISSR